METVDRAERLRVLLSVGPWLPDTRAAVDQLSLDELAALDGLDEQDLALANACHAVESEMRARAFAAVERLGAAITTAAEPGGAIEDRVRSLPNREFAEAVRAIIDLGWVD